jgi:hypothetical protein
VREVKFQFDIDEVVKIKLTEGKGIVTFLGFDDAGIQYAVKTKENNNWWKESQIEKV